MFKSSRRCAILYVAVTVLALPVAAQETVEGRLLEVLKAKGIIDEAEYADLRKLETELRENKATENQLDARIDEMISSVQDEAPSTSYTVGKGFTWRTADERFRLSVGGRLQVRFTYDGWSKNARTDDEDEPDFDVPRARIWLRGNVFETYLKYKFQFDIAGDEADTTVTFPNGTMPGFSSGNRLTELKDAHFDFAKWKAFSIRGGQFKVPYSRHWLVSSGTLEFVDRSITNRAFSRGRDVGLMIYGKVGGENEDLFEYYAGAFDGEGENRSNNDRGLLYVGRVAFNPFGGVKYTESDTKNSEDFKLAIGLNAWLHEDDNHTSAGDDWSIGFDVAAFWQGFFGMFELHYRENDAGAAADVEILGWVAQLGYFIIPNEFEVALRYATIDWDNNGTGDSGSREYLLVLGYFWHEHNMKLQLDFGRVEDHQGDHADNTDEWRMRLQFQVIF
ncbi:MAG: hypothetical protein CMJ83_21065 [Planctomycetes bacterium]|nr:hypothetical protein [Planctomycetota bacterium]